MFLSDASIKRPVAMCSGIIALVLLGLNAYNKLGVENLPKIDVPYVTIVTVYPGGSPEEIETDVAKKIEDVVVSIDGLKHVTSSCMENVCQTLLEFNLDVDVDIAANDVREKLDLIANELPKSVEKPKVIKFDINAKPIASFALTGEMSLDELYDYADNQLRDRISVLSGVADVQLTGGAEREVHVLLDRDALAARGLLTTNIVQVLKAGIGKIPSGRIQQNGSEFIVKFDADFEAIKEIGSLEAVTEDGSRCYIRDIATIVSGTEERRQATFINGRPAIGIRVVKKADANTVKVVNRVREVFALLQKELPGGMELIWVIDDGDFVQASVDAAQINIFQGIGLTAAILFLFLFNIRSTLIVAISMPVSIVISVLFMKWMNFTLNMSTLLALGLSVGVLVTNSIVVLEHIIRHLAEEHSPSISARRGTSEVAAAVLASAGTNIVVLVPIATMGGMMGLFFKPFAMTMVIVTFASLVISFTLTPILSSLLLKHKEDKKTPKTLGRVEEVFNGAMALAQNGYGSLLKFLAGKRWLAALIMLGLCGLLILSFALVPKIGFTFIEEYDQAQMFVKVEFPPHYNMQRTTKRVQEIEERLKSLPGLKDTLTTVGKVEGVIGMSSEGVHLAQVLLTFEDKTRRDEAISQLQVEARRALKDYPDSILSVGIPTPVGGQMSPVWMEVAGTDLEKLDQLAEQITGIVANVDGTLDPDNTVRLGKPELLVRPNRPVLADLKTPVLGMGMALRGNLEGIKAATFKRGDRTYDIRVKFAPRPGKTQVEEFLFPGEPGRPVPLTALARIDSSIAPIQITRKDKQRISQVFANLKRGTPLGTVVQQISQEIDNKASLPPGYNYGFTGMYEQLEEAFGLFSEAALIALVLVYLLLAAILESFVKPLIILLTIPLGLVGMLWALYLTGVSMSIFVLLGGVMLIGIVVNNAILIMNRANHLVAHDTPPHAAMVKAATEQFRPIVMITMAAVLGMLPLAIGQGLGSENRTGIGIASIGGIAVSGVLTLIVIPTLYDLFTRKGKASF
ncbi:MAG: efflux RND transporter permease subunit [Phycisphaerae bacterium]|nr:efflux RND transporter permease subunit [Phycisphaerae bacterium]